MRPTRRMWVGALTGLVIAAVAIALIDRESGDEIATGSPSSRPLPGPDNPNVVVVMTDDQALDTMVAMPRTRRLLGRAGTTYENAIASYPLCCPSRATFLTGQYAHNHGVLDNKPPEGGYDRLDTRRTLPVWLQRDGYRTAFVGKFLNGYGKGPRATEVPPGWDEWYALPGDDKQRAFDFELNENGKLVPYEGDRRRHKTALLADKAARVVRTATPRRRPFFLWVATNGPHRDSGLPDDAERNPLPEPRDHGRFEGKRAPRSPATDERDVSDKPASVRELPALGRRARERLDREYVSQLESLLGIDRLVARLVRGVRAHGELANTVFVFTSDHGFLRGQHRLEGKSRPYEESIRVPLLIRGPGFAAGARDRKLAPNIDLAPTILDVAGASADVTLDGRTLRRDPAGPGRDAVLLEVLGRKHSFTGVRTDRYTYAEHEGGDRELYDLQADPAQLENLAADPDYEAIRAQLAGHLRELRDCRGPAECG